MKWQSFLQRYSGGSKMRNYKKIQTEKNTVTKIVCNKCKKEITIKNEEEMLTVEKRWGYFSHKDGELHRFDICEECYDTWIASFQIPVYGEQELEC
jgi:Fe2+ or Zn2+ uptake regulation protein